jgi:HEAT repeat protein
MRAFPLALCFAQLFSVSGLVAQETADSEPRDRIKAIRSLSEQGGTAIPALEQYLADPAVEVRRESVKAIVDIGTQYSLGPLVKALGDSDPEIQIRATDGLVNFYLPGYVRTGLSARLARVGSGIKGRFTDTNDQIIEPHITVRSEINEALGKVARGGASMETRANAARALGILRGQAAIPDLQEALKSKDSQVLYEVLIAFIKIRDTSVGPSIRYLLRDLDERVQIAAIEATGVLQNREALADLVDVLDRSKKRGVRRAALTSIAMMPDPVNRVLYLRYLNDKDEQLRASAAEGLGRLASQEDISALENSFQKEKKMPARLGAAFGLVLLGRKELADFSPLQYLINTLNSSSYTGMAKPYLIELARDPHVREVLNRVATQGGTREEKTHLAEILGRSGDQSSQEPLEILSRDPDPEVARAALRSLQALRSRLP